MSDIVDKPQVESQNTTEKTEEPNAPAGAAPPRKKKRVVEAAPIEAAEAKTEKSEEPKTPEQIRGEYFIADLDKKLAEENVKVAFAIILDPKSSKPIMFGKGTSYQLARVLVDMARHFKEQVVQDLKV